MSVTERIMAAGSWSLRLQPTTPQSVLRRIDVKKYGFGHIVVTPVQMDPSLHSDAVMLAASRYTGVYRSRPSEFELAGAGVNVWVGDEEGKGPTIGAAAGTASPYAWSNWVTTFEGMAPFLTAGARTPGIIGAYQKTFEPGSHLRGMIEDVCARFDTEWRVTNDFKLDLATADDIYRTTPIAVVLRRDVEVGRDKVLALQGGIELSQDLEDWSRRVRYLTGSEATPTISDADGGVLTSNTPYRAPDGTYARIDRVIIDYGNTPTTDGPALAALQYGRFDHAHEEIRLGSIEYDIGIAVHVGDNLWVYDPERDILDPLNPIAYRGQTIYPQVIRCVGHTWPIREGMGVYFRRWIDDDSEAWVPDWVDLTPFVEWESGAASVDIGSIPRTTD